MRDWDRFFMDEAIRWSSRSKDPNKQVGAVVVGPDHHLLGVGYNGFPADVPDDCLLTVKEIKNQIILHAEDNALYDAESKFARWRFAGRVCTLYITAPCCAQCASRIIRSNLIKKVVQPGLNKESSWYPSHKIATRILTEANIQVEARNYV